MLRIQNLNKRFNNLSVIEGFNMVLPQKSFSVLIGPSGCGKTTLFDILTGILPRDSGSIEWEGEQLTHLGTKAAYMQQKDLLLPWLSLLENALLPSLLAGKKGPTEHQRAHELFSHFGLGGFELYLPQSVSGGMRQRCALIRTLMFEREIVLLDEPLSALDAITRRGLQTYLAMLKNQYGKTVLMISHDIDEALALADDIIVLTASPMRVQDTIHICRPTLCDSMAPSIETLRCRILNELEAGGIQ
jgi:putative hydroxymethylpyrimidine transport system ATP-binding protein